MDMAQRSTVKSAFVAGSGKSHSMMTALSELSPEWQSFALLLVQAIEDVADEAAVPETDVRSMVYRMFQAAVLQGRRAPGAAARTRQGFGSVARRSRSGSIRDC